MPLLINKVPTVRGKLVSNADISSTSWFKVGGPIELLFIPEDLLDLTQFIENLSKQKLIEQASLSSMKLPKATVGGATMKGFRVFVKLKRV